MIKRLIIVITSLLAFIFVPYFLWYIDQTISPSMFNFGDEIELRWLMGVLTIALIGGISSIFALIYNYITTGSFIKED
jgi:hypothetical protein